jgi:hypothetical protein
MKRYSCQGFLVETAVVFQQLNRKQLAIDCYHYSIRLAAAAAVYFLVT